MLIIITTYTATIKHSLAVLIGAVAGFGLYHASFGFTSAWRRVLTENRGAGLRAQFLLVILISMFSFPLIAYGDLLGLSVGGAVAPISFGMVFGAFLFGIGMQFGGGCGSGTLFTIGGGSTRMVITLTAFIMGSLLGTLHLPWWRAMPKISGWSLIDNFGPFGAFIILTIILIIIGCYTIYREKLAHGVLEQSKSSASLLSGPWSPIAGVIALAFVGIATFIVLGRPWGITSAFSLWGAKAAIIMGVDVASWPYWSERTALLNRSIFKDTTTVMNFAIIGGAMAASGLANKYQPIWRLNKRQIITALIGGLLMGYGARLAYGCNIGAYLGGLVSGSLHGWVWMIAAFIGSATGIKFLSKITF